MKNHFKEITYGIIMFVAAVFITAAGFILFGREASAVSLYSESSNSGRIFNGVHIDGIDVSGMTKEEAAAAVDSYIESLYETQITLIAAQNTPVNVTMGELSPVWNNPEVLDEASACTADGNVIARYKLKKDIEHNGKNFALSISFDSAAIENVLAEKCSQYDIPVENPTISRNNGEFVITEGKGGEGIDTEAAVALLQNELYNDYVAGQTEIALPLVELDPAAAKEDLAQVKDLLGTFTTSYSSSGPNRSKNVANGCRLINGTILFPGEEFSAYDTIKPFTEANGYYLAGSYLNGQVVESLGGGICQVSSTLYNAVLRAELTVTERHNHSLIVNYVDKSADAAIAESSGKDFKFVNSTDYPIYIEGYTSDKRITFNIYGVETRPDTHKVEFESEVLSEMVPDHDNIIADAGQPIGYVSTQSAHIGYNARLWKITYENGEEVSREEINSSYYAPSPRSAVVGTACYDPNFTAIMQGAIASGSIDTCKSTAAQLKAQLDAVQAAGSGAALPPDPGTGIEPGQ